MAAGRIVIAPGRLGEVGMLWRVFLRSIALAWRHGQFEIAKGVAFSALVAFFPLLTAAATILVQVKAEFVSRGLERFLTQVLPPSGANLAFEYLASKGAQPVLLPLTAALLSLLAAGGVTLSLMVGFRAAYNLPAGRPFLAETLVAILVVASAIIPALGASLLILLGTHVERWVAGWIGLLPAGAELRGWVSVLGGLARNLMAAGAIVVGAAALYYLGPNRTQRWRWVWPGAVLVALLWFLATSAFAWYVRNIANYNVMYGSIAAVIALLMWMYLLSIVALVGCEFNALREQVERERRSLY